MGLLDYIIAPQPTAQEQYQANDKIGRGLLGMIDQVVGYPSRYQQTYQPGQSVRDDPSATNWAASTALGMVGTPIGNAGLGSGARLSALAKILAEPSERVASAAMKVGDQVFTGANHGLAYEAAIGHLGFDPLAAGTAARGANLAERRGLNGFVTSTGRFVDRAEAEKIANSANQTNQSAGGLMAHDLDRKP